MNFETQYKKYYSKVHKHAASLLNHTDVDDVVQEIFLKIEKGLPNFKGESKISTWIHRITVNHCIDIIRKRKAQQFHEKSNAKDGHENTTPCKCKDIEVSLIDKEMNECIRGYINQLPESFKEVVLLSDIEGYSNNDIAAMLDISLNMVKIRLHRGRQKLKNILTKQCCLYYTDNNELACEQK